ncbi:MAG: CBS domain-containing protein, partial [Chromatiales bacterium]
MSNPQAAAVRLLHRDLLQRHPIDAVRLLEKEPVETIARVLADQPVENTLGIWERIAPDLGIRVLESLPEETAAAALGRMDPTRAASHLVLASEERREGYLALMSPVVAAELREVLTYPADSAGALMDPRAILLRPETTVKEALERLRESRRRGVRMVFVVDDENRLDGTVAIQDLAAARPTTP